MIYIYIYSLRAKQIDSGNIGNLDHYYIAVKYRVVDKL